MRQWQGIVKFIKEEIIGSENTFLAWSVLAAMAVIVGIGFYLNSPDASFHGVAGSRESNVNFEYPVEIKSVHVLPGQRVRKGDLLVELDQSELNTQIRQLSAQIAKLKAERSVRDQMNKAVGNDSGSLTDDPLTLDISQLEEERSYLERQRNNLYVFADIDGIVGSVNFKRGERAPSFSPIVTISPDSPTFVQGFIYEQLQTSVSPGAHVRISSLTNTGASVEGKVVSVGARFVEIPLRLAPLAKSGTSGIWGREVMVEIPKNSQIILGEKVQISPVRHLLGSFLAQADEDEGIPNRRPQPRSVRVPADLEEKTNFEASGALYLPDLKKYLVVSDDTNNQDAPWIFLMSEEGEVESQPLTIPGIKDIRDMESVSAEGEYTYVMSSLSARKKGTLDGSRNLLVRFRREGRELKESKAIFFGRILRDLIQRSSHPLLRGLKEEGLGKLEVEAHTVKDGALYIALKAPAYPNADSALILRLPNVDALFAGKTAEISLEVWKNPRLNAKGIDTQRITDITFAGENLYFTTSCKGERCGAIWTIGENDPAPRLIQSFESDSPEGVAFNPEKNLFLVTFDLGDEGSKFLTINGPRAAQNH